MSLKVILEKPPTAGGHAWEHVFRQCRLDYTDMLELTLKHWEELTDTDNELLQSALEREVYLRWARKRRSLDYPALMEAIRYLAVTLAGFHEALSPALSAFMQGKGLPPDHMELELIGWSGGDPIVRIKRKPMPVLNLTEQEV